MRHALADPLPVIGVGHRAQVTKIINQQVKKTAEQRRIERLARLESFERFKIHGESRGWQIVPSGGMPVMQWIVGGRLMPVPPKDANKRG